MIKDKKRGKKNNKSGNKPEASTNVQDISKCKRDSNIYKGVSPKLHESTSGLQARPNSPQNETIEKGGNKENGRSTGVLHATLQSVENVTANESEMATSKPGDNQAAAQVGGKSKKTRKRRRGKSILDTSGSESFPSAGHGNQKLGSTNIASGKDTDLRSGCENKAFDYRDLISQRITQIESKLTGSKSEVNKKHTIAGNKSRTSFEKEIVVPLPYYVHPKDQPQGPRTTSLPKAPPTSPSIRPIIFIVDKATQTDPAPGPPSISKSTDRKNSTTLNSDSNGSVVTKSTEPTLHLPGEETNAENADPTPEPQSISKSTDGKNSTSLNSDSNGSIVTEPTLLLPIEETNAETVSEHTDTLQNKISLHSSLSSPVKGVCPSMTELLRYLKISDEILKDDLSE